jgi:hypothetical protein
VIFVTNIITFAVVAMTTRLVAAEKALFEEKAARSAAEQSLAEKRPLNRLLISLFGLPRRLTPL